MMELDWSADQMQVAIWIVIGIIIIEGIWLAYLTFMMWRRHLEKDSKKPEKVESQTEETAEKEQSD